jgi:hypothetical protein
MYTRMQDETPPHNIQVSENTRTEFLNIVYSCITAPYIADDK